MDEIVGKYVILPDGQAILFSLARKHSDFKVLNPVSAGFFTVSPVYNHDTISIHVYGESTSLHLSSRKEDEVALRSQFGRIY